VGLVRPEQRPATARRGGAVDRLWYGIGEVSEMTEYQPQPRRGTATAESPMEGLAEVCRPGSNTPAVHRATSSEYCEGSLLLRSNGADLLS
jgi:hypothetical protein